MSAVAATPPPEGSSALKGIISPWQQYICHACGYIYNEAEGDPDSGLVAGTRFVDIPDDWYCPLCGVTKQDFELYSPPSFDALRAECLTGAPATLSSARHTPGVVIVGAGRAGWQLAENLRASNAEMPITIVTSCAGDVYDKPLLSVAMARQLTPEKLIKERGIDAARRLNLRMMSHTHAIRICRDTKRLRTTRGTLRYDHLVLAHGAQAALPPELSASLCWRINHLGVYLQLRAALGETSKEVVIVGAGLIGSELANDLALGGHRITLLDVQSEPLARWQAEAAGQQILQAWKDLPIRFVGGVSVSSLEKIGAGFRVTTACGQQFAADQVIVAAGLQTPSRLAKGAGLAWENGIAVDLTLRTSDAAIHALGDCISIAGQTSRFIEPIARQALTLAAELAGQSPLPYAVRPSLVRVKTSSLPLTLG